MHEFKHPHICVTVEEGYEEIVSQHISFSGSSDEDTVSVTSQQSAQLVDIDISSSRQNTAGTMKTYSAEDSCVQIIADIEASCDICPMRYLSPSTRSDMQEFINLGNDIQSLQEYKPCRNALMGCRARLPAGADPLSHACFGIERTQINATPCNADSSDSVALKLHDLKLQMASLTMMLSKLMPSRVDACTSPIAEVSSSPTLADRPSMHFKWGSRPEAKLYINLVAAFHGELQSIRNISIRSTIFELRTAISRATAFSAKSSASSDFDLYVKTSGYELCLKLEDSKTVADYQPRYLYDGAEVSLLFRPKYLSMGCGISTKKMI